ncbi:MAG: hypothetical protein FWH51_06370 [Dehalococcoidia bacterium]|nr:hypothetical protein [Dehalococcoidia bacterium]
MSLIPQGGHLFEIISRYDDLLAMQGQDDYEPGDTLALIVPFLIRHGLKEADIIRLARGATLTRGAGKLIRCLMGQGWHIFCITTTYQQYAFHVTQRVGIPHSHVAATAFPLDQFHQTLSAEVANSLAHMEHQVLSLASPGDDQAIKQCLDDFFWTRLPQTALGQLIKQVKPVGGRRKLLALEQFCELHGASLGEFAVVGDSITDFSMLRAVRDAGGLAIAFNANQYALPHATVSLASTHLSSLSPILAAWQSGTLDDVKALVKQKEASGPCGEREHFHWLIGKTDLEEIIATSQHMRRLVREKAGELG